MDFVTLFFMLLVFTLIISAVWSILPTDESGNEYDFDEELQNQGFQSDAGLTELPSVPGIDLERAASFLPEEYEIYFEHSRDEPYNIPQVNSVVGNLCMMFVWREVIVVIGTHTEIRFDTIDLSFEFVGKVLRDEIVFRIDDEETIIYPIEDFEGPGDADRNDYVWSSPLKHKLLFRD